MQPFLIHHPLLLGLCPITQAVERLAHDSDGDERDAVFTQREVVDFMLAPRPKRACFKNHNQPISKCAAIARR